MNMIFQALLYQRYDMNAVARNNITRSSDDIQKMGLHSLKFCRSERELAADPFCDCNYERVVIRGPKIDASFTCVCGEEESNSCEWIWDEPMSTQIRNCVITGNNVSIFHPVYSQGTAVLIGNKRLEPQKIHYWEVKTLTPLVGTDLMIGIGTDKTDILSHHYKYSSFLGLNDQSWGYSYKGKIQHNKENKFYGKSFSYGTIIGVLLDLHRGTLSFSVNRIPMGIAYTNIPTSDSVNLFPMICCTTANSAVKLMNSSSCSSNLQYLCLKVISQKETLKKEIQRIPGLKKLLKDYWFLMNKDQNKFIEDVNKITLDEALDFCNKKKQLIFDFWPELEINCGIVGYSSARPTRIPTKSSLKDDDTDDSEPNSKQMRSDDAEAAA